MLHTFDLDPDIHEAFMYGDCWRLAYEVHKITGWQMVAVGCEKGENRSWNHMAVRTPQGHFLDINGVNSIQGAKREWMENFFYHCDLEGLTSCVTIYDIDEQDWQWMTSDQFPEGYYPEQDAAQVACEVISGYIKFCADSEISVFESVAA